MHTYDLARRGRWWYPIAFVIWVFLLTLCSGLLLYVDYLLLVVQPVPEWFVPLSFPALLLLWGVMALFELSKISMYEQLTQEEDSSASL